MTVNLNAWLNKYRPVGKLTPEGNEYSAEYVGIPIRHLKVVQWYLKTYRKVAKGKYRWYGMRGPRPVKFYSNGWPRRNRQSMCLREDAVTFSVYTYTRRYY